MAKPKDVLDFWFGADPKLLFAKSDAFDASIRNQFGMTLVEARAGQLADWEDDLEGLLALVIVLDQFSRNLYRNSADAFAFDNEALRLSHKLASHPDWDTLSVQQKQFGVMPMMHAESLAEQKNCLEWMEKLGLADGAKFAQIHLEIIERFGRFPHRNEVLGRETTIEEQQFLDEGGFSG